MKKKLFYIAVIVICLSIITGSTLAYYTTSDTARNVITSGGIDVTVVEQEYVGGTLRPYQGQPVPVMPETEVSKIVSAQSNRQSAWIRMNYNVAVYSSDGKQLNIPAEELDRVIVITPNPTNWIEKDGWWYYPDAIGGGSSTQPLFTEVAFSGPHKDNKYQQCTVVIDVTAQAVQKANNGSSVMEALGWPD